jgi:manganese efflux pump family protein
VLKLLAFVLPLGLDSFAVAAAIGAMQVTNMWQRLRISLVFVIFEGGMPLIGLALGTALARGIGQAAGYLAGAAVIAIGAWMLLAGDKDEEDKASRLTTSRGLALIALGVSISLDELAIGFTIGLAHLPVTAVIVAIALQAFIAAQLGLAIGARIGERSRERAETGRRNRPDTPRRIPHRRAASPVSVACRGRCASGPTPGQAQGEANRLWFARPTKCPQSTEETG